MEWDEIQSEFDRAYGMSCKPSGLQKYKAGHIFDENMSVKWNRDKLEEENKKFKDEVSRLNTAKRECGTPSRQTKQFRGKNFKKSVKWLSVWQWKRFR